MLLFFFIGLPSGSDLSKDDDRQFDVDEAEQILASYKNDG